MYNHETIITMVISEFLLNENEKHLSKLMILKYNIEKTALRGRGLNYLFTRDHIKRKIQALFLILALSSIK